MLRRLLFGLSALMLVFVLVATPAFAADTAAPVAQDDGGDDDGGDDDGDNGTAPGTLPDTGTASDYLALALLGAGVMVLAGGLVVRRRTA